MIHTHQNCKWKLNCMIHIVETLNRNMFTFELGQEWTSYEVKYINDLDNNILTRAITNLFLRK